MYNLYNLNQSDNLMDLQRFQKIPRQLYTGERRGGPARSNVYVKVLSVVCFFQTDDVQA